MKKTVCLILLGLVAVTSVIAQMPQNGSAGTEFYFTLFDHSAPNEQAGANPQRCGITLSAVEDATVTFSASISGNNNRLNMSRGECVITSLNTTANGVLKGVHVQSTGACYMNVWLQGSQGSAESVILPKHLLGNSYVLQGAPGTTVMVDNTPVPVYSQFTVIGTADGTVARITPQTDLTCLSAPYSGQLLTAHQPTSLTVNDSEVLLFRCNSYSESISGTYIEASQPVAVFQGNDLTRIPDDADGLDYTWEQARPITAWGREFAIPISSRLNKVTYQITAAEGNTEVYMLANGSPTKIGTLQSGESLQRTIVNSTGLLTAERVTTTKPACCYLFTTGSSLNNELGDPAMTEIVPLDVMATDSRWCLGQTEMNSPFSVSLVVTTWRDNGSNILMAGTPLTECSRSAEPYIGGDFETYEIPLSIVPGYSLIANQGGFSAYVLKTGKVSDASAFNLSLPASKPELCMDGVLLFREDFGGNDPSDPSVSSSPVPGMADSYQMSNGTNMTTGKYLVAKQGYRNGIQWHLQDDHTYFGDYSRGYFLEVDATNDSEPFYSTTIRGLCTGSTLTFSAYVANVTYAGQIPYLQQNFGYAYPRLRFELTNPYGHVLASQSTGDIMPDYTKVWDINRSESAEWQLVGMNFTVPEGVSSIKLYIYNDVTSSGIGNDFALDDIEIRLCLPPVEIEGKDSVCPFAPAELIAVSDYQQTAETSLEYRWLYSVDSIHWTEITGVSSSTLSLASVQAADSGWYKVIMAAEGNIGSTNCRNESEPFKLHTLPFRECLPPVTIRSPHNVCEGRHYRFDVQFDNNGVITQPIAYRWQYTRELNPDVAADDIDWITLDGDNRQVLNLDFESIQESDSGWYRIIIANEQLLDDPYYCVVSEPFHLRVSADCPVCTDGKLLFKENFGGSQPDTSTQTFSGVCAGTELSVIANLADASLPDDARLIVTLVDTESNEELKRYEADATELEEWRRVGFNFGVPVGTTAVELRLTNPASLSLADLLVYLCAPAVEIVAADSVCREASQRFTVQLHNGNNDRLAFAPPLDYQWYHSPDQNEWTPVAFTGESQWLIDATTDDHAGWYKVAVAEQGNVSSENCRAESDPFRLHIRKCLNPPQSTDTVVCDTLLPYPWHSILWPLPGDTTVMLLYTTGEDSLLMTYRLMTEQCCPDILYGTAHLTICDTLLPYTWNFHGTPVVFSGIHDEHSVALAHWHWTNCTDSVYTLTVDTFHCERLWPIIVNKYNWQLLVNHVALRTFFPERTPVSYQWYKDDELIDGATGDDYAEQNELHGIFQLLVWMDDGSYIWSNLIALTDTPEPLPVSMRIYNSNGVPVSEQRLTRGVYIIFYQQGTHVWTQKKIVL